MNGYGLHAGSLLSRAFSHGNAATGRPWHGLCCTTPQVLIFDEPGPTGPSTRRRAIEMRDLLLKAGASRGKNGCLVTSHILPEAVADLRPGVAIVTARTIGGPVGTVDEDCPASQSTAHGSRRNLAEAPNRIRHGGPPSFARASSPGMEGSFEFRRRGDSPIPKRQIAETELGKLLSRLVYNGIRSPSSVKSRLIWREAFHCRSPGPRKWLAADSQPGLSCDQARNPSRRPAHLRWSGSHMTRGHRIPRITYGFYVPRRMLILQWRG